MAEYETDPLPKKEHAFFVFAVFYIHTMQRTLFRISVVFFLLCSSFIIHHSSFAAPAVSVETVVKKLQARYDATKGFRADFAQEVQSATLGQKVEARGQVYFRKPGRMRWEFVEPEQLLVSDGKFLWLYQPADKQVIKTPFEQAFRSNAPASFLLGIGRIDQDFTVTLTGETKDSYSLRLTPKKDPEAIGSLDLEVDAKNFDISQATIIDPLGNTTRLQFMNIDRKAPLDDSLFLFTLPPGIDVVDTTPPS